MTMVDRQARDLPLDAHLHTDAVARQRRRHRRLRRSRPSTSGSPSWPSPTTSTSSRPRRATAAPRSSSASAIVRDAAERWADRGVAIRFGVEITWDSRCGGGHPRAPRRAMPTTSSSARSTSIATRRTPPTNVAGWVAGRSLAEIVAPYFDEVDAAPAPGLFDVMGHLDFVKRYLAPHVTARRPRRRPGAVRADPRRARRERDRRWRSTPAACASRPARPSRAGHRRPLPRARGPARHHRVGRPPRATAFAWALDDGYASAAAMPASTRLTFRRGGESRGHRAAGGT